MRKRVGLTYLTHRLGDGECIHGLRPAIRPRRVPIGGVVQWGRRFNSAVILAKFQVPVRLEVRFGGKNARTLVPAPGATGA